MFKPIFIKVDRDAVILPPIVTGTRSVGSTGETSFDIEAIAEKLENGDLSALDELDNQGVSYTLQERNGGYTIKFAYEGTNYRISYNAPVTTPETEPVTPEVVTPEDPVITPEDPDTPDVTPDEPVTPEPTPADEPETPTDPPATGGDTGTNSTPSTKTIEGDAPGVLENTPPDGYLEENGYMPSKEDGIYSNIHHPDEYYIWNPTTNQMEGFPCQRLSADDPEIQMNPNVMAVLQGYQFTEQDGIYAKDGKFYEYNQDSATFTEVTFVAPSTRTVEETPEPAETTPDTGFASIAGEALVRALDEVLDEKIDNISQKGVPQVNDYGYITGYNIHTEFGLDKDGKIVFQEQTTTNVYNELVRQVKQELKNIGFPDKNYLEQLGGDQIIEQLIQAAWMQTYNDFDSSTSHNAANFIKKVVGNLQDMVKTLQTNPELYDLYAQRASYADTTLTKGLKHYNTRTTYGEDELINYGGTVKTYDDGSVHIDNTRDDKDYQTTMNELLTRLKAKYPNVDEATLTEIFRNAQREALAVLQGNKRDCPYGTGNNNSRVEDYSRNWGGQDSRKGDDSYIHMDELVQMTLYQFDKQLIETITKKGAEILKKEDATTEETTPTTPTPANEETPGIVNVADKVVWAVEDILDGEIAAIVRNYGENIHTEFGVDRNGNIVFQEQNTTNVYNNIFSRLKKELNRQDSSILQQLGGEAVLKDLLQAAWITAYNRYNSSQSNNTEKFVKEVLNNLKKMINKIKSNPDMLEVFTSRTSYADTTLTSGLKHYNTNTTYGGDELLNYGGDIVTYTDGTVHISNTNDDNDYQTTMNGLLERLIKKYPNVDASKITEVFRNAQREALSILQGNERDCPYGTGNNNSRVEDYTRNWGGKDNRKGDKSNIHMDELVQMTLYCFDKLFYQAMMR